MRRIQGNRRSAAILGLIVASAMALPASFAATLRVGTSGDYPPFSSRDAQGKLVGFDIAVAERLAADLGMEIAYVPFQWPNLIRDLQAGRFDVAMSGVTVRADRLLDVEFTRPYAKGGAVIVVRQRDAKRFAKLRDADRADVRIAVNAGGHLERVARQHFARAAIITTSDNRELPSLLRDKRVDVVVSDSFEARAWAATDFFVLEPFTLDRKAYATRRDAGTLIARVDEWLLARESDGWLATQRRAHFGKAVAIGAEEVGIDALASAIGLRLQLMPYVAAVKRREQIPVEDLAQEARVLNRAGAAATSAGLNAQDVTALFGELIVAAKSVEHAKPQATAPPALELDHLRTIIASISDRIIAELRRYVQRRDDNVARQRLRAAIRSELEALDIPADLAGKIADAAVHVRKAAAAALPGNS